MKNTKLTKIFIIVLSLALLVGSAVGIAVSAEGAASTPTIQTPTESGPDIISQNIYYQGSFNIAYAIDPATVSGGSVTVNVFDSAKTYLGSYTASSTTNITPANSTEIEVYVVKTSPIAAKDMADQYYAQAIDADGNVGDLKRYSVAEYLFERLYANGIADATEGADYNRKLFYNKILEMGALAQTVLINDKLEDGATPETLVTDYSYISVSGGTIADSGFSAGIAVTDSTVTITADASATNEYWTVTTVTYTDGVKNTSVEVVAFGTEISVVGSVFVAPYVNDAKGEYYLNTDIEGKRVDYDVITEIAADSIVNSGTTGSFSIVDGALMFEDGDAESKDMVAKYWLSYPTSYNCTVFEFDFKLNQSYGSYPIQIKITDDSTSYTIYYSKTYDSSYGTGYKLCMKVGDAYIPLGTPIGEWSTIRFEHYYDSAMLKVYVNNEYVLDLAATAGTEGTPKIYLTSNERKTASNADLYVDNVFVGHITKTYVAGDPEAAE